MNSDYLRMARSWLGQTRLGSTLLTLLVLAIFALAPGHASAQGYFVQAWGFNYNGDTDVPAGLTNTTAISSGGEFNLALRSDRTMIAWGTTIFMRVMYPASRT